MLASALWGLLENNDTVIKGNRSCCFREFAHAYFFCMARVELINQVFRVFYEGSILPEPSAESWPVGGVHIFNKICSIHGNLVI